MQKERNFISDNNDRHQFIWWARLIRDRRWSVRQKRELIAHFKCPSKVLSASAKQVREIISGKQKGTSSLVEESRIDADMDWLGKEGHYFISICDPHYPPLLRQLVDAPLALFAKGNINLLSQPQIAVVGSRNPTPLGEKITRELCTNLASLGIVITSGLALGIDGIAHQACLDNRGDCVAVLGNGLDIVYPSRNKTLFDRLSSDGLLISEYPLGVPPSRYTFPQRNRIVSGLSYGVVIIEAAERSGTLITARLALEQNRELMVVPGSVVSSQYKGSHNLIKQGAALVANVNDVLHCLSEPLSHFLRDIKHQVQEKASTDISDSHPLLKHISFESTSVDDIILSSQLTSAEVSFMLLELELIGAVAIASDGGYVNLS